MKPIITMAIYFILSTCSLYGQEKPSPVLPTGEELLLKSKKQKTTGWCLLGGGSVSAVIGLLIPRGEYHSSGDFVADLFGAGHYENDRIRSAFFGVSFGTILGGTFCLMASGRNKRKAASLSLENQQVPVYFRAGWAMQTLPSLQLTIKL